MAFVTLRSVRYCLVVYMLALISGVVAGKPRNTKVCDVTGTVVVPSALRPSARDLAALRVSMDGGSMEALVQSDGAFTLRGVRAGTHRLHVLSNRFAFPPVKIVVEHAGESRVSVVSAEFIGEVDTVAASLPLKITAESRVAFFEERKQFNLVSAFIDSKLYLLVILFGLAYLSRKSLDGVDPAERKQMMKEMSSMLNGSALKKMQEEMRTQQQRRPIESAQRRNT